jgi:hypothetical protein
VKKKNRKVTRCLNCDISLQDIDNFCPNCGQENTDNYVSTRTLLGDFLNNYFSFDSRFNRTFAPFLTKPGLITKDFLAGKRLKYANPIRWYIVISLIHFFVFNISQKFEKEDEQSDAISFDFSDEWDDASIDSLLQVSDSLRTVKEYKDEDLTVYEETLLEAMLAKKELTVEEVYDSLHLDEKPLKTRAITYLAIKGALSDEGELKAYILEQVPVVVFCLLPIFALLLKLFFFKKGYYIKHLIHSLHLHSFFFLIMSLGWLVSIVIQEQQTILIISFALVFIYSIFSFRRLYEQRYIVLLSKIFGLSFIYTLVASVAFLIGILLSIIFV